MNLKELLAQMDAAITEGRKAKDVTIRGLGKIYVRELTIGEVEDHIRDTETNKGKRGLARGACRLLCDENGKRLLDPDNVEHVAKMAEMPLRALTAINKTQEDDDAKN